MSEEISIFVPNSVKHGELNENTLVIVKYIKYFSNFTIFWESVNKIEAPRAMNYRTGQWTHYLAELYLDYSRGIFLRFLDKFGLRITGERKFLALGGADLGWEMEYGFILHACRLLKRNPQELERIMKVAKTKKDLKIHLGVS